LAISNENGISLEDFRFALNTRLEENQGRLKGINIHEVTQLIDGAEEEEEEEEEDGDDESNMGDCFVVELCYGQIPNNVDESDDEDDHLPALSGTELIETLFPETRRGEVWVEGQGSIPLAPPYGWRQETFRCPDSSDIDHIQQTLKTYGVAFITSGHVGVVPPDDDKNGIYPFEENGLVSVCQRIHTMLSEHVTMLEDTVRQHHPHIVLGESAFGFQEYTHRGIQRFEVLFDPNSSFYQLACDTFESLWMDFVCRYLNSPRNNLRLNISCVYSRPGATDQDWHTDGDHQQHPCMGIQEQEDDTNTPYALCIFVPLIRLTRETGFTRFWPKSHHYPNLLGLARAADALQATVDGVNLHPGDFIIYDYTTWHKGVGNTSDLERPVLQFLYSADWYIERKNYGTKSVFDTTSTR